MPSLNGISSTNTLTTSNASPQTAIAVTIPEVNSSGYFNVRVVCRRLSDGATKAWAFNGMCKRGTGNAETVSALLGNAMGTTADLLALLLTNATVDASGEDIRVRVTGLASTDIIWLTDIQGNEIVEDP